MRAQQIIVALLLILFSTQVNAQFWKKLGKTAQKAAERTVEKRVDEEAAKKTDKTLDSVFDRKKKKKDRKKKKKGKKNRKNKKTSKATENTSDNNQTTQETGIRRNSDFTPGTIPLFEDRFIRDHPGDFPAKWDTNGSGEITLINTKKWLRLGGNSKYLPITKETLPENYTIEFDLFTAGLDKKTSSQAYVTLLLENNNNFTKPKNWCMVEIGLSQFIESQGVIEKVTHGRREIRNKIGKDFRTEIKGQSKISIAINKTRMRVWLNENKIIDIPRLIPQGAGNFKIATRGLRDPDGLDEVYISNFRIAKTGEDNRSKLLTEGRLTTNNILFESASATIKNSSFTTIREIASVLEQNPEVRIKIIGHTDTDGPDGSNLTLSRKRAAAVKDMMTSAYGIAASRISTDGMGESQPVASNATKEGRMLNRRVEFIKM